MDTFPCPMGVHNREVPLYLCISHVFLNNTRMIDVEWNTNKITNLNSDNPKHDKSVPVLRTELK